MILSRKRKPGSIHCINSTQNRVKSLSQALTYKNETNRRKKTDGSQEQQSCKAKTLKKSHVVANRQRENSLKLKQHNYQTRDQQNFSFFDIDMQHAHLTSLSLQIDDVRHSQICTLNVSHNSLSEIPSHLFEQLTNLRVFEAHHNRITKISFPYKPFRELETLDLSDNGIRSLTLEHVTSLTHLSCDRNEIDFLTLPPKLKCLSVNENKLKSIYFLQNCNKLVELNIAANEIYELNFCIAVRKDNRKSLVSIDCSRNCIRHLAGFVNLHQLQTLILDENNIVLDRDTLQELVSLTSLQHISLFNNPLEEGGYIRNQMINELKAKMPCLKCINGEAIYPLMNNLSPTRNLNYTPEQKLSELKEKSYRLFLDSEFKTGDAPGRSSNFTLGDAEEENENTTSKFNIQELSEISINKKNEQKYASHCVSFKEDDRERTNLEDTIKIGTNFQNQSEIKIQIIRTPNKTNQSRQLPIQAFKNLLSRLLSLSYIPKVPLRHSASKVFNYRLQTQDQQYRLLDKILANRGGLAYAKKIALWSQNCPKSDHMMFLANQIGLQDFKLLKKSNELIRKSSSHRLAFEPHLFSFYLLIVRTSTQSHTQYYPCTYLVQVSGL